MKRSKLDNPWVQYLIVLFLLTFCAGIGITIANAETVEATQPHPRIEWVTVDVGGKCITANGKTGKPLPPGTWICVPVVVTSSPPSRRDV